MSTINVSIEENAVIDPGNNIAETVAREVSQTQRLHYLDNLRALAMLLGVFLHAGLAYAKPAQSIWLATDTTSSVAVDASVWLIHLFRMGLFFLISGYFGKMTVVRKGVRSFLKNRCLRIAVPFVIAYPFLLIAMTVVFIFAFAYVEHPTGLMGMIAASAKEEGAQTSPPPSTMHLWFLYYLMIFSLMAAWLCRQTWIRFDFLTRRPVLIWLCPIVLVPAVLAGGTPLKSPESFIPEWWPILFYGSFFLAGWKLYGKESMFDPVRGYVWHLIGVSGLLFVIYYWLLPELDLERLMADSSPAITWTLGVESVLTAYLSVLLTLVSLLLGQRYLSAKSKWLAFLADSSYWLYLMHLPITLFLQTLFIPLEWPLWVKLVGVIVGSIVPCLVSYVVFVRYTPIGWLLHGKRSFP